VQRKSVLFGFNPVLFGLGRDEMKRVLSTEKIWSTWYATEYPELAYQKQGERNWRFIDTSTGNAVGKSYPTCASLRMNIRRYAKTMDETGVTTYRQTREQFLIA
jgi:hypothetical protein